MRKRNKTQITINIENEHKLKDKLTLTVLNAFIALLITQIIPFIFKQYVFPVLNRPSLVYQLNKPVLIKDTIKNKVSSSYIYTAYIWNTGNSKLDNLNICFDLNNTEMTRLNAPQGGVKQSQNGNCSAKLNIKSFNYQQNKPYQVSFFTKQPINTKNNLSTINIEAESPERKILVKNIDSDNLGTSEFVKILIVAFFTALIASFSTYSYTSSKFREMQKAQDKGVLGWLIKALQVKGKDKRT